MKFRLLLNFIVAIVLVVLTAEYGGRRLGIVDTLERLSFDWRIGISAADVQKNHDIVIIDIDRDSLRSLGDWPWRRDLLAQMLDQLFDKYDARLAAFSFSFPTANNSAMLLSDDIRDRLLADEDISSIEKYRLTSRFKDIEESLSYDKQLVEAIKGNLVFLGYLFDETGRVQASLPAAAKFYSDENSSQEIPLNKIRQATAKWPLLRGYSGNIRNILTAATGAGHITRHVDSDGQVRSIPLFAKNSGRYYKSLALAILQRSEGVYSSDLPLLIHQDGNKIDEVAIGRYRTHMDSSGGFYLNYMGPGGRNSNLESEKNAVFRYVSAVDVINGDVSKKFLKGKICIIGSSSEQLNDLHSTPLNPELPGAELIATQLANIIDGRTLFRPSSAHLTEIVLLAIVSLSLAVAFVFVGPLLSFIFSMLAASGFVYLAIKQWHISFEVFHLMPPLLSITGLFLFNALSGFVLERRSSRRLKNTFGHYVPPELAKRIGSKINMEGESREISVLFSDIFDFTSISEGYTPEDLTKLMNRMLTGQTRMIYSHSGTVDKFIGDAVMAFWNAPLDDENHAQNSVYAALDMQKNIQQLSEELQKEGRPAIRLGIGICSGPASVGNMGSEQRVAYTALGDTVNAASRVEGLTRYYQVPILVADTTRKLCGDNIIFRPIDIVQVKGKTHSLAIYEPLGEADLLPITFVQELEIYEKMFASYINGDFETALSYLRQFGKSQPDDLLVPVYEKRLQEMIKNPPENWDGVRVFSTK